MFARICQNPSGQKKCPRAETSDSGVFFACIDFGRNIQPTEVIGIYINMRIMKLTKWMDKSFDIGVLNTWLVRLDSNGTRKIRKGMVDT